MKRRIILLAVSVWTLLPAAVLAQAPGGEEADAPRRGRWDERLKFGLELRGRAESGTGFDPNQTGRLYLNRLRLDASAAPAPWFQLFFQGQDARASGLGGGVDRSFLGDAFDVHQAYLDLRRSETGWRLRVGRQELSLGDERLLGADSYWDAFGQAFDAVRVDFTAARVHAMAFSGFRVEPSRRRLNPFDTASRIAGLSVRIGMPGEGVLEPYSLWKRGGDTVDLLDRPGHRDVFAPGIRAQAALPHGLDYNVEMVLERGHVVGEAINAWAGHWELGWKPLGAEFGLRLGLEYNFASGDADPADGRYGTFDDLYPAGFNKYGMADPIAWRNIRYPAIGAEVPLSRRWTLYGAYRHYRLASIRDGLYPGGDRFLVRNPAATTRDVGAQALVSAGYAWLPRWRIYAGYCHLFPGGFLRQSGFETPLTTVYILSSLTF
ncbi:MAG: alginate export family protein [Acidobacteria bacterium]|nr:alginate export family protein [Acidobacteriota bacterium]